MKKYFPLLLGAAALVFCGCGPATPSIELGSIQPDSVNVTDVELNQPGFVAIYQSINGEPGPLVGQGDLLQAGTSANLNVAYTSKPGEKYIAMLHADNNQDGKFDESTDNPVEDANGNTIIEAFTAPGKKQ